MEKKKATKKPIHKPTRRDKKINQAKVAKAVLANPTASEEEIAKMAWVSTWTAHNHKKEIEETWVLSKDPRIRAISDKDLKIVELTQDKIIDRLEDEEELKKVSTRDLSAISNDSIKRHSLIMWSATDKDWGLKSTEIVVINDKQAEAIASLKKSFS